MEETLYILCTECAETFPTSSPYNYTKDDLKEEYERRFSNDYNVYDEFTSLEDAVEAFISFQCRPAELIRTTYGYYYYLYEVAFIKKLVYDDDGNLEDVEQIAIKASSIQMYKGD